MSIRTFALVLVFATLTACSPMHYTHGIPNLAQVNTNVWRSGQITTQEGWNYIRALANGRHVHVIKLNFDTEGSDDLAARMGIEVHVLAIQPEGDQSTWDDLKSVFKGPDPLLVDEAETLLVGATADELWLVHCTHGQDRTGYVIGRYRVLHDHWTKDRAYQEMRDHHFHPELHGVHEAWDNFRP